MACGIRRSLHFQVVLGSMIVAVNDVCSLSAVFSADAARCALEVCGCGTHAATASLFEAAGHAVNQRISNSLITKLFKLPGHAVGSARSF